MTPFAPHKASHVLDTVLGPEVEPDIMPEAEVRQVVEGALRDSEIALAFLNLFGGGAR